MNLDNVTIYFLKDIIHRKKKALKNNEIKRFHVPQYDNLTLKCIGEFICQHPAINDYLPDQPDLPKTPKQWIVDVCAAVIGQPFKDWVKEQVEDRNAAMKEKREMMIDIDPEMKAAFQASTHVSRKYLNQILYHLISLS